jgi:hypothetical protein
MVEKSERVIICHLSPVTRFTVERFDIPANHPIVAVRRSTIEGDGYEFSGLCFGKRQLK